MLKVLKLTLFSNQHQTGVAMLSSTQICFVFFRWLWKIKGISLRFIFLLLFTLSSSLPFKLPLLQTLSRQSAPLTRTEMQARLKSTTMRSWAIAEGWHCERIRKMILWAGNLVSLNKTLSELRQRLKVWNILRWQISIYCSCANSCRHIKPLAWCLLQEKHLRKSLCLSFGYKEWPFVFMTSIFCFVINNIALDVYEP